MKITYTLPCGRGVRPRALLAEPQKEPCGRPLRLARLVALSLSNSADTVVYAYYGNAVATNQQNPTGVWDSNYKGVWHFGTPGSRPTDAPIW